MRTQESGYIGGMRVQEIIDFSLPEIKIVSMGRLDHPGPEGTVVEICPIYKCICRATGPKNLMIEHLINTHMIPRGVAEIALSMVEIPKEVE